MEKSAQKGFDRADIVRDVRLAYESQRTDNAARDKKRALARITSALGSNQFLRYLRDQLLLDKCVD